MGLFSSGLQTALYLIFVRLIVVFTALPVHECAHAFVASKLGDNTAKYQGRLTLNPMAHLDLFGTVILLLTGIGWAKPVPIDMRNFKYPKRGMAISALAGPLSNVLLSIVFLFLYGFFFPLLQSSAFGEIVLQVLYMTAYISIAFAVFNIIPIPPLDGSKVLDVLLPERWYHLVLRYERYLMLAVVLLAWSGAFGGPLTVAMELVLRELCRVAQFPFALVEYYFF